jgi:hypothetical protein
MQDTAAIYHKLDQLEDEMMRIRTRLDTVLEKLGLIEEKKDAPARSKAVAIMDAASRRINLSEEEAMKLANEAVQAVRAQKHEI